MFGEATDSILRLPGFLGAMPDWLQDDSDFDWPT